MALHVRGLEYEHKDESVTPQILTGQKQCHHECWEQRMSCV